jgi:Nucleoside-diphosphate-sugar epimerases
MMDLRSLFAGKRVLVAGGLGFIGSNLARRLVELGADVLIVDALIPAYGGNPFNIAGIENRVRVNIADVRNESVINHLVQGQDFLFNLVGQVSHIDSMQDPYTDLETNCRAQIALLEACRRYNPQVKIVYTGTRQVYGRPRYLPVDEEHPVEPVDINGVHKMAAEWYHRIYHQAHGLRTVTLRLTNTYGPPNEGERQPPRLHRVVDSPGRERKRDRDFRDRSADSRLQLRRRCGGGPVAGRGPSGYGRTGV